MKKIGFIDYFIDEWHSNNYINWIPEVNSDFAVTHVWSETDTFEGKQSTDDWCAQRGVVRCSTIAQLCEACDYIMILAPSNPEKHLEYAREALKCGKNTYIDKTFAPDLAEAREIFALAEQYGTKFFTTSALRYGDELDNAVFPARGVVTTGGGRSLEEYIIHQIEMIVRMMGVGAQKLQLLRTGGQSTCIIRYKDGRQAVMNYAPSMPFTIDVEQADGTFYHAPVQSGYFKTLMRVILTFFQSGELPFDTAQTLEVMAIREAAVKAETQTDMWIAL